MFLMLGLFLVSKIIHLIHVIGILVGDLPDYRNSSPALILDYPPDDLSSDADKVEDDSGTIALRNDCFVVLA